MTLFMMTSVVSNVFDVEGAKCCEADCKLA